MKKIFYINSSHWDREWYVPFQSFRYNLVDMINSLLDIMENDPEYKIFCLDGQTIVLEDYEEIEPERAKTLKRFIEEGRIIVGPWYVMPDEFLLSGESLIRNLMVGDKIAKKWGGKPMKYGYVNDIFGHIAQMPQIFRGFDIKGSYLGRGLGNTDYNHFVWKSPDGSECYTTIGSYSIFARNHISKFDNDEFDQILIDWIRLYESGSEAPVIFFSNTDDHKFPTAQTPYVIKRIEQLFPDMEVCHTSPSSMADELELYKDKLPQITGELSKPREKYIGHGSNLPLLYHCLSSYYPLKYENDYCQNLLEKKIEPMVAFSNIDGNKINHTFVDLAYKYLLQNHPHDSICGCSADQVHKDMIYRFDQVKEISDKLYETFTSFETDVFKKEENSSEYEIKLYNNLLTDVDEYRIVKVNFYKGFKNVVAGYAGKEFHNNFSIYDIDGDKIEYQIVNIDRNVEKRIPNTFQGLGIYDVYSLAFKVKIPACGYTILRVVPEVNRVAYFNPLNSGSNWAENDYLRFEISMNGEISIYDKRTGKSFNYLNELFDNGEVGDGWQHETPINDIEYNGCSTPIQISKVSNGLALVTFNVIKEISLPIHLDSTSLSRSEKHSKMRIEYSVTLKRDSKYVEVEMSVDNNIKDHRLRLMFDTGIKGGNYFAGQPFCFVERPVGIDKSTITWNEPECIERNMNGIVGKRDNNGNGLAFVSPAGLHECAGFDNENGSIGITLFRSFDRVFLQTKAITSQLQQKMHFKYAIVPLSNDESYADLLRIQNKLSSMDIAFSRKVYDDCQMKSPFSYLKINDNNIILSIFKCAEDKNGYIVRMFNACEDVINTRLDISFEFSKTYSCNMNEEIISEIENSDSFVKLSFKPWEVKTIKIF